MVEKFSLIQEDDMISLVRKAVAYKGRVLKAGGFGVKTKGSTNAPDSNTIFRVGSVSKIFPVS